MYYHVSKQDLDGVVLNPRVPINSWFIDNGYEDCKTPRICVAKSIDDCLTAIGDNIKDMVLNVYIIEPVSEELKIKHPSKKEVPDVEITNEIWILNKAKCNFYKKIKVLIAIKELTYKLDGEIYSGWKWDYEYID